MFIFCIYIYCEELSFLSAHHLKTLHTLHEHVHCRFVNVTTTIIKTDSQLMPAYVQPVCFFVIFNSNLIGCMPINLVGSHFNNFGIELYI